MATEHHLCLVTLDSTGTLSLMENITHSLIGLIAGESLARTTPPAQPGLPPETRRRLFVTLTVIGGNLPDVDLAWSSGDKLRYLLQHRGYTHTLLGCVVLALLLYGLAELWTRMRSITLTPRDRRELVGVALFGTGLHLAMDTLNSYGVHPFWPFRNEWMYGDSVFIVEPLYWAAAAPLIFVVRSWVARIILGLMLLAGVAASLLPLVPPLPRVAFLVLTLALLAVGSRVTARTAALVSASVTVLITATFIGAGYAAARRMEAIAGTELRSARVIDHVLTPLPMNPLCWDVLLLVIDGDRYSVRHAMLADAPRLLPARSCPIMSGDRPATAPMEPIRPSGSTEVRWLGQFEMSRVQLAAIVANHCEAAALMQFARAPFATELGRQWVMGDLRFDRDRLATIQLGPPAHGVCRGTVPWVPPRMDLLRGTK
jgi:inner membrane protein